MRINSIVRLTFRRDRVSRSFYLFYEESYFLGFSVASLSRPRFLLEESFTRVITGLVVYFCMDDTLNRTTVVRGGSVYIWFLY